MDWYIKAKQSIALETRIWHSDLNANRIIKHHNAQNSIFIKKSNLEEPNDESRRKYVSFKELLSSIPEDSKIHTSYKPINQLKSQKQTLSGGKPVGLWYACGSEWLDWAEDNRFGYGNYVYVIDIDKSRILKITTEQALREFSGKYSYKGSDYIRWDEVSQLYSGIEICPYQWNCRLDTINTSWYYGWDIASGCIWDSSVLTVKSIGRWDGEKIFKNE